MKLLKLFSFVIAGLVIANVIIANTAVDESVTVKKVTAEIEALNNQNLILKQQIASLGSLSHIATQVEARGFVDSPKIVTLTAASSVALR